MPARGDLLLSGGAAMSLGTVKTPTIQQIGQVAVELGFNFNDADLAAHLEALGPAFAAYNILDQMPDELPPVSYPRCPGRRPTSEENPHGAWYVKTEVPGGGSGKLAGKRIALKDNICLAGVPMMNGASTLEGYVPDVDATVATRILDAGGTIVGKTVCEYFCFSGGSHTSATGPVHNPHRMGYSAGGSSSGSAAVVAAGEVPMALGGDQGGSIRIPAAFCGIYGMKPTHRDGSAIWLAIAAEGATMQMMLGNGFGFNWQGLYVTSMLDFHSAWRTRADELSDTLKNTMLLGHFMVTRYRGHYYAKAQNLVRRLQRAYDEVLSRYDLLLMPTLPLVATRLPEADAPVAHILQRGFEMLANTAQFDCTHHPAMSLPCGLVDELPVGMMLVAKAFDEETIYRAAAAFENGVDWKGLRAG